VRTGKIDGAVIIPAQYSRRVYSQDAPVIGFVTDNSDQFTSGSLEAEMQLVVTALTTPPSSPAWPAPSPSRSSNSIPTSTT